jgi:hypothetical protein
MQFSASLLMQVAAVAIASWPRRHLGIRHQAPLNCLTALFELSSPLVDDILQGILGKTTRLSINFFTCCILLF